MNAIIEHNIVSKYTEELNNVFKYIIFILYYLDTLFLMFLLYISHANDTYFYFRFASIIVFVLIFVYNYSVNLFSSLIMQSSSKPVSVLYQILSLKGLTIRERLKIQSFIERLSESDIGFYCLDLFPMNEYEFYLYSINCAKTYFLVLQLITTLM